MSIGVECFSVISFMLMQRLVKVVPRSAKMAQFIANVRKHFANLVDGQSIFAKRSQKATRDSVEKKLVSLAGQLQTLYAKEVADVLKTIEKSGRVFVVHLCQKVFECEAAFKRSFEKLVVTSTLETEDMVSGPVGLLEQLTLVCHRNFHFKVSVLYSSKNSNSPLGF